MPMAFVSIAKLEKFTSKEDDTQIWINDVVKAITANNWNDTKIIQVIPYFLKDTANLCLQTRILVEELTFTAK
ncbi:hypothetical protein G9A89_021439 [Geosiphon pyriformis]|nr:hypothetical protein G9A89_021439 [Geosiphon pyriformis]